MDESQRIINTTYNRILGFEQIRVELHAQRYYLNLQIRAIEKEVNKMRREISDIMMVKDDEGNPSELDNRLRKTLLGSYFSSCCDGGRHWSSARYSESDYLIQKGVLLLVIKKFKKERCFYCHAIGHCVGCCEGLAQKTCRFCGQLGHTGKYCGDKLIYCRCIDIISELEEITDTTFGGKFFIFCKKYSIPCVKWTQTYDEEKEAVAP